MQNSALIAMSGGVDSSVAAYLMAKNGYSCAGATMRLFDKYPDGDERNLSDINDAKSVCTLLGIDFHIMDCRDKFKAKVIDDFIRAYELGRTPNPCVVCNKYMKFGLFLDTATDMNFDKIATGHYARIEKINGDYYLKKAFDEKKDQTYFLYSLTPRALSMAEFPLGSMSKDEIRAIASDMNFVSAHKSDSQDICFAEDGDYISLIKSYTKKDYPKGDFVNIKGEVIGTHEGIINYTIGQRRGLGTAFGEKVYVKDKNANANTVTLAKNDELFSRSLTATGVNRISFDKKADMIKCRAKIRYSAKDEECIVHNLSEDSVFVEFKNEQRAISKGQAVVFYDDEYSLGGGTID